MATLPQELIAAIIYRLKNKRALKKCALASSSLREPSQRILFRAMKLDVSDSKRHTALSAFLIQSPHIAGYISNIRLPVSFVDSDHAEYKALQDVLTRLTNVRRCTIAGVCSPEFWNNASSHAPLIVDFIERQTLTELHLFFLYSIPLHTFALFLSSASTVTLYCVDVAPPPNANADDLPLAKPNQAGGMIRLLLSDPAETVCAALALPQLAAYSRTLRKLKICPRHPYTTNILSSAARTLQYLRLDCSLLFALNSAILPLPPLDVLRFIDLRILSFPQNEMWFMENFPTILDSAPTSLEEISVTDALIIRSSLHDQSYLGLETLQALDRVMINSSSSPRLRLRLEFKDDDIHVEDFVGFQRNHVQHGMSRMHAMGRVLVQRHSPMDDLLEWPVR